MNRSITKNEVLFILGFLFTLAVGVGAFFFGLHTGKVQSDAAYKAVIEELADERNHHNVSYHEQQLVSFYHTVLLPFREFQTTWFEHMRSIESGHSAADENDLLKELARMAKERSESIQPTTIPDVSPLLQDAQKNYLRSLTLFAEAAERLRGRKGADLADAMKNDPYVAEAANFALKAQSQYYEAIWKWSESPLPESAEMNFSASEQLEIDEWRNLNLNAKNVYISRILEAEGLFGLYEPQDVSARIDELDTEGQLEKLQLADVGKAVSSLTSTGAVRYGDFKLLKEKLYRDETVPMLPSFF